MTRPGGLVVVSDLDTETLFLNSSNTQLARSLGLVLGVRLDRMADRAAVTEFWAELELGEREGWLCSGVVCFTVSGHTVV